MKEAAEKMAETHTKTKNLFFRLFRRHVQPRDYNPFYFWERYLQLASLAITPNLNFQ